MKLFSGDATIKALKKLQGWIYWICMIAYLDPNSTSGATKVGCYDFFQYCQQAQYLPKLHILSHENVSLLAFIRNLDLRV